MKEPDSKKCLTFRIQGDWGHFRRVDGNSVKSTYSIPPRTTISGLLAAIIGMPRNSYYDIFNEENSSIAITPENIRTMNIPVLSVKTTNSELNRIGRNRTGLKMSEIRTDKSRLRENFEYLVNPSYIIDIWVRDEDIYQELKKYLQENKSVYTPSIGLSEHLATIDYIGESTIENVDTESEVEVDSAIPGGLDSIKISQDERVFTEKSPGFMESSGGGGDFSRRKTTGFIDWVYSEQQSSIRTTRHSMEVKNNEGKRVVCFS